MKILSYNPGHDGAIAFLQDARLMMCIEAEKDSNARYSPVSSADVLNALGELRRNPRRHLHGRLVATRPLRILTRVGCSCRVPRRVKE